MCSNNDQISSVFLRFINNFTIYFPVLDFKGHLPFTHFRRKIFDQFMEAFFNFNEQGFRIAFKYFFGIVGHVHPNHFDISPRFFCNGNSMCQGIDRAVKKIDGN